MEDIEKKPSIFEKLQICRVELQKKNLKKSGKNTFSHYEYFELGDFLPQINELLLENRLTSIFNYTSDKATLRIFNMDIEEDFISFETPIVSSELKGCSPIQSIGAMQTYARRYLYVMALEISENDIVNTTEVDEEAEARKKKIDLIKVKTIRNLLEKSHSDEASFCKWARVEKVEDITNQNFSTCVNMLDKAVLKYEEDCKKSDEKLEGF